MKLEKAIYEAPTLNEGNLLEEIDRFKHLLNLKEWSRGKYRNTKQILDEFDLIQQKKSKLTKSQRDQITGFVGLCITSIVKGNGKSDGRTKS